MKHGNRFIDMTGKEFTYLKVIEFAGRQVHPNGSKSILWKCECKCGNTVIVQGASLRNGNTKSCGCLHHTVNKETGKMILTVCKPASTHGKSNTRLYRIYSDMVSRCFRSSCAAYKDYGGRGITVCDEWYTPGIKGNPGFVNFYNWAMENGYDDTLSIDRKDNDGPYAPWNCRWTTNEIQGNNRRTTKFLLIGNEKLSYTNIERKYGLKRNTISQRFRSGWDKDILVHSILYPDKISIKLKVFITMEVVKYLLYKKKKRGDLSLFFLY